MDLNKKIIKRTGKHEYGLFSDHSSKTGTDIVSDYSGWEAKPAEILKSKTILRVELKSDKQYYFRYIPEDSVY